MSLTEERGQPTIAYLSMEIGVDSSIPTYSGGLGILAGDTLRAAADQGLPMVGVTLHVDEALHPAAAGVCQKWMACPSWLRTNSR